MEEESQLWVACSPFIQVPLWFKQGEGRKKKRKNRRNQGLELSYFLVWKLYVYGYYKYGTYLYGILVCKLYQIPPCLSCVEKS